MFAKGTEKKYLAFSLTLVILHFIRGCMERCRVLVAS